MICVTNIFLHKFLFRGYYFLNVFGRISSTCRLLIHLIAPKKEELDKFVFFTIIS